MKKRCDCCDLFMELKESGIINEEESKKLFDFGIKPLPLCVRINSQSKYVHVLQQLFQKMCDEIKMIQGHQVFIWNEIKSIRKDIKEIIDNSVERNYCYRQELCSMFPPIIIECLSKEYNISTVADVCAAPGSKTTQLAENKLFVTANDIDPKRVQTLAHRLNCWGNVNITNCSVDKIDGIYDCILCDVPCSGDGTLRKSSDPWFKWKLNSSFENHRIQLKILRESVKHVKNNGLIVYSTCSMNPIEDEAVVHSLLSENEGNIELIDIHNIIQNGRKGMNKWKSHSELTNAPKTLQPPQKDYKLENCVRILPQDYNSGGFFVAALRVNKIDNGSTKLIAGDGQFERANENDLLWNQLKLEFDLGPIQSSVVKKKDGSSYSWFSGEGSERSVFCGCKLFERRRKEGTSLSSFRLCEDGLFYIQHLIQKRRLQLTIQELLGLEQNPIPLTSFNVPKLNNLEKGSVILEVNDVSTPLHSFYYIGWIGKMTLNHNISKEEWKLIHLLLDNKNYLN